MSNGLSAEQVAKVKAEVADALARDRHRLVCDFPFTGAVAMRLDLVPVRDARVATACTDAKKIYFDCGFYSKLAPKERTFVLAHEIWHCVMMHFARRMTRDQNLFNIATDMEVNALLKSEAKGKAIEPPDGVLFPPPELEGKSAEEIYDALLKEAEQNAGSNGKKGSSKDNASSGSSGSGQSDPDRDRRESAESGKCKGQFDRHIEQGEDADGENGSGMPSDQWGEKGFDPDFNQKVAPGAADEMREIATAAAQSAERVKGTLPAGVKSLLERLHKPEIDWREMLATFVTKTFGDKRQWLPPNRRHVHAGSYFQSRYGDEVKVTVAIDTSGSCLGDLPKFFSELKSLVEQNGRYTVDVIQCDAAVASHETYDDSVNPLEIDSADDIEVHGCGGTSFTPVFEYVKENGIEPDCLIYFTDGYGDAPENPPNYPVMWILTSDGTDTFCEWGTKTRFKEVK